MGGTGVHVTLSGSHAGVKYQLYLGTGVSGGPLPGSGTLLDFGLKTSAGTYTVIGTDTTTGCTKTMLGAATITINPAPALFAA